MAASHQVKNIQELRRRALADDLLAILTESEMRAIIGGVHEIRKASNFGEVRIVVAGGIVELIKVTVSYKPNQSMG